MPPPQSATRHYNLSALIAQRAVTEAERAAKRGATSVLQVLAAHQVAQAQVSQNAVTQMLLEQGVTTTPDALINPLAFTTDLGVFTKMSEAAGRAGLARLVGSLVQDAGRSAESVATATRSGIGYVRYLSPPSCSRCAVLAGRWYRWSEGFRRHPHCDCVMLPARESAGSELVSDPTELAREGKISGLSKADQKALADGADLGRVVNIRLQKAGLSESGRVLARRGRPTPEAIYARSATREEALTGLQAAGYLR